MKKLLYFILFLGFSLSANYCFEAQEEEKERLLEIAAQYLPKFELGYAVIDRRRGEEHVYVTSRKFNVPVSIDFDGDYIYKNNYNSIVRKTIKELEPTIYYEIIETETHYFIYYYLNYPYDSQVGGLAYHENDCSSVLLVVDRTAENSDPTKNNVVAVLTFPHSPDQWNVKKDVESDKKRIFVSVEPGGHASYLRKFKRYKHNMKVVKIDNQRPRVEDDDLYIRLDRIFDTYWKQRASKKMFQNFVELEEVCPKVCKNTKFKGKIGKQLCCSKQCPPAWLKFKGPYAPWARYHGHDSKDKEKRTGWFFDPANVLKAKLAKVLKVKESSISTKYIHNPYLGVLKKTEKTK